MPPLSLLEDLTRLGRTVRRAIEGEDVVSSMAEELISKERARYAGKITSETKQEKPKCKKTPGCIGGQYHEGGCTLIAEVVEE